MKAAELRIRFLELIDSYIAGDVDKDTLVTRLCELYGRATWEPPTRNDSPA